MIGADAKALLKRAVEKGAEAVRHEDPDWHGEQVKRRKKRCSQAMGTRESAPIGS